MIRGSTSIALVIAVGCVPEPASLGGSTEDLDALARGKRPSRGPVRAEPSPRRDEPAARLTASVPTAEVWPAYAPDPFPIAVHAAVSGHHAIGQAFADWDGDGDLDLYVTGGAAPSVLLENQGDGTLVALDNIGDAALLEQGSAGAAWADYDHDDDPDLLVATLSGARLLRNDGPDGFTDITDHAGVGIRGDAVMASWGDFNHDGWLDVYVAFHFFDRDVLLAGSPSGKFTPVQIGSQAEPSFAGAFLDYDDDGYLDLYTCVDHDDGNHLRRNAMATFAGPRERKGPFIDVSEQTTTGLEMDCMGIAVGDYDNDLDLDLYMSNIGYPHLLRNGSSQGQTTFDHVAEEAGVEFYALGWGTLFFDFDNDGWLDLYLATQDTNPQRFNRVFHNLGDGTFQDVSLVSGASDGGWSYGVGAADLDGDGFVELVIGNRGEGYRVLRNTAGVGGNNHWLSVELRGAGPVNRDAIGSRVWVTTTEGDVRLGESRSGSTMGGGDQSRLHFGLGQASVDHVTIRWPDGTYETIEDVPTDAVWTHDYPG